MATKSTPAAKPDPQTPDAETDVPALPSAIRLGAYYSGFDAQGAYYVFNAGDLITSPAQIEYFVGRGDTVFEIIEG